MERNVLRNKRRFSSLSVLSLAIVSWAVTVHPLLANNDDKENIKEVIGIYYQKLNEGDQQAMQDLYTNDVIAMVPFASARIGKAAVIADAKSTFEKIAFNTTYEIKEIVVSGDWAFVRVNSIGTLSMKATGNSIVDSAKAVYILRRQPDDSWKIARYIFNPSTPL